MGWGAIFLIFTPMRAKPGHETERMQHPLKRHQLAYLSGRKFIATPFMQ
jgi:hypothetical protein